MTMKTDIRAQRARLIKLIHVARRELALDEATYRLMLANVGGSDSTMNMELSKLKAVVEHLKRKGFKVRASVGKAKPDRRQDNSEGARKVRALWLFLAELGALRDPSEIALAAYCKRIAKVDDLHWVGQDQMRDLIETLKQWANRFLSPAIEILVDEAVRAIARRAISADQAAELQGVVSRARDGGFDAKRHAWEMLTEVLNGVRADPLAAGVQP